MESYEKQEKNDKKLIKDLRNPDSYKTVGNKKGNGKTIDFIAGMLFSFRLLENNRASLEIGDVGGTKP